MAVRLGCRSACRRPGRVHGLALRRPRRVSLFYEGDIPFWRNLLFTEVVHPPAVHVARGAAEQSLRIVRELGIDTADALPMLEVSGHAVDGAGTFSPWRESGMGPDG